MLGKTLFAAAALAASASVMADSGTRVYGSVVIADPNFSMAITSAPYAPRYYGWAPPPVRYVYYPAKPYYRYEYHHRHQHRYDRDWDERYPDRGAWGRPGPHRR